MITYNKEQTKAMLKPMVEAFFQSIDNVVNALHKCAYQGEFDLKTVSYACSDIETTITDMDMILKKFSPTLDTKKDSYSGAEKMMPLKEILEELNK